MVFANFFLLLSCLCIRLVYICPKSLARVHDISSHNANALTTLLSLLGSNLFQSNLIPSASISIYICIYYISTCLSINQSIYIVSILYLSCLIYPFYLTYGHRPHWTPLPVSLSLYLGTSVSNQVVNNFSSPRRNTWNGYGGFMS